MRPQGTAIYYLLEPGTFSEMHVLDSDEMFHFYLGDPVEMLQLHPDGSSAVFTLGPDLKAGQHVQLVVPAGVWQGTRLIGEGKVALLGCTVTPGFDFADYRNASYAELAAKWPTGRRKRIRALTGARFSAARERSCAATRPLRRREFPAPPAFDG